MENFRGKDNRRPDPGTHRSSRTWFWFRRYSFGHKQKSTAPQQYDRCKIHSRGPIGKILLLEQNSECVCFFKNPFYFLLSEPWGIKQIVVLQKIATSFPFCSQNRGQDLQQQQQQQCHHHQVTWHRSWRKNSPLTKNPRVQNRRPDCELNPQKPLWQLRTSATKSRGRV